MPANTAGPVLSLSEPNRTREGVVFAGEFAFVSHSLLARTVVYRRGGVALFEVNGSRALHNAGAVVGDWLPTGLALGTYQPSNPGNLSSSSTHNGVALAGKYAAFVRASAAAKVHAGTYHGKSPAAPVNLTAPVPAKRGATFSALGCGMPAAPSVNVARKVAAQFGAPWDVVVSRPQAPFSFAKFKVEAAETTFAPLLFFEGAPVSTSYVVAEGPFEKTYPARQRVPVIDLLSCCQGVKSAGECGALQFPLKSQSASPCASAMKSLCSGTDSDGDPNFTKPACAVWANNSNAGKLAVDTLMESWCDQNPDDERCACIRATNRHASRGESDASDSPALRDFEATHPSYAGLPPVCVFPACRQGSGKKTFMTSALAAAAKSPLCESARDVAARQRALQTEAAARAKTTLERAERRKAITQAYMAAQYIPVWEWLLFAAFALVCVTLFLYLTRHRVSVVVNRPAPAVPTDISSRWEVPAELL